MVKVCEIKRGMKDAKFLERKQPTVWPENLAGIKFGGLVMNSSWRILIWRFGFASNDVTQHVPRTPHPVYKSVDCATMEAELSVESCV